MRLFVSECEKLAQHSLWKTMSLFVGNTSQQFPVTVQLIEQTKLLSDQSGIEQDTNESASVAPETWGMWGRFPASSPHTQRLIRTASGVCQSPGSAYSWPEPEDCTGGSSQTPDRCSALAARYQRDPLKRRKRRQSHNIFFFLFTAVLENACLGFKMLADFCLALIVAEVCVCIRDEERVRRHWRVWLRCCASAETACPWC